MFKTAELFALDTDACHGEDIQDIESLIMDLTTLRIATNNFAENNKLGEGGFGVVYKVYGHVFWHHILSSTPLD